MTRYTKMDFCNSRKKEIIFSIIVPTCNRPQLLTRCLDSISKLDYPYNRFEAIIVDDGSRNSNENVLTPFRNKISLKFIRQENSGPASARNTGASQAIGEFLAFTDDDCMPAQNWLSELEHSLLSAPGCMVGGRVINGLSENIYAQASQIVLDIVYAYYNPEGANPHFFAANNMAVPASVFRSVGGFDVSYYYPQTGGEDRDFCDRWLGFGHGMVYASRAIVNHYHDLTLSTFWKQHMAYGRGAFRFNRSHACRDQKNSTIRFDFYISLFRLFSNTTSGLTKNITSRLLFLMVIWQAANSMGFFSEMIEYLIKRQRTM